MKEAFLHYLWKFLRFEGATSGSGLQTTSNQNLQIIKPGMHNQLAGPDFFNAQIRLDGQHWAGNVEIHVKSSDWYVHNHEQDEAYSNVILHVVWEEDCSVYDRANQPIPTLELKDRVSKELLSNYKNLLGSRKTKFINCEADFATVPEALFENWVERVYFERLERKVLEVEQQLTQLNGDWEALLFCRLARNFGTVINASAFEELAGLIPFTTLRKINTEAGALEAVLLGISGLLPEEQEDTQVKVWSEVYNFSKTKFKFNAALNNRIQYFKLRPPNFPTIRLSHLANLYQKNPNLFEDINQLSDRDGFQKLLRVKTSPYWETHYNFGKTHPKKAKWITPAFIDLLLINTIIPIKFAYARERGFNLQEGLFDLLTQIPLEKNSVISGFQGLRAVKKDALHSQALLQLKKTYCDVNRCLQCQIGDYVLRVTQD